MLGNIIYIEVFTEHDLDSTQYITNILHYILKASQLFMINLAGNFTHPSFKTCLRESVHG